MPSRRNGTKGLRRRRLCLALSAEESELIHAAAVRAGYGQSGSQVRGQACWVRMAIMRAVLDSPVGKVGMVKK